MQSTFQAGVDAIYNAIVAQGTTPAGKTPDQLATGIGTVDTNKYNAGYNAGKATGGTLHIGAVYSANNGGNAINPTSINLSTVIGGIYAIGTCHGASLSNATNLGGASSSTDKGASSVFVYRANSTVCTLSFPNGWLPPAVIRVL